MKGPSVQITPSFQVLRQRHTLYEFSCLTSLLGGYGGCLPHMRKEPSDQTTKVNYKKMKNTSLKSGLRAHESRHIMME